MAHQTARSHRATRSTHWTRAETGRGSATETETSAFQGRVARALVRLAVSTRSTLSTRASLTRLPSELRSGRDDPWACPPAPPSRGGLIIIIVIHVIVYYYILHYNYNCNCNIIIIVIIICKATRSASSTDRQRRVCGSSSTRSSRCSMRRATLAQEGRLRPLSGLSVCQTVHTRRRSHRAETKHQLPLPLVVFPAHASLSAKTGLADSPI